MKRPMRKNVSKTLLDMYGRMAAHFGPLDWWPGDTPFEIAVGAILTQNTNWTNVEKAIANLKRAGLLEPRALRALPVGRLAGLIRPSGYFNVKAKRLHNFLKFLVDGYGGSLEKMFRVPLRELREKLLAVNGIGPETADSILLYAGGLTTFVVDAYTKRVLSRHGLIRGDESYEDVKRLFEENLPPNEALYNEFHAQFVNVGKNFCRTRPLCESCPLGEMKSARARRMANAKGKGAKR
jgi:endonuclease-3 related protein